MRILLLYFLSLVFFFKCSAIHLFIHFALWLCGTFRGKYQKEILLIRMDALGDFLISANLFEAISQEYHRRNYRVVLIHTHSSSSIVQYLPWFDECVCIPKEEKKIIKMISVFKKIASRRAEIAVRCSTLFGSDSISMHPGFP